VIPALGRQKQADQEFKVSLDYIAGPCLKNKGRNRSRKPTRLSGQPGFSPLEKLLLFLSLRLSGSHLNLSRAAAASLHL
jgi:hypothetical protein